MESNGRVGNILFKRDRSGRNVQAFQIEAGSGLKPTQDGFLDFFLAPDILSTACQQNRSQERG